MRNPFKRQTAKGEPSMFAALDWRTNSIEIPITDAYSWVSSRGLLADVIKLEQVMADNAHRTTAVVVYNPTTMVVEQVVHITGLGAPR
jgi:hypothetical protein